jgi:anti-sigma B factor antagonist
MPYELTVKIPNARGCIIVTPAGELDIATAPQLRECLLGLLPGHPALVVDLDQVSFCDAAGLGVLVGAANRARANGASVHLVCTRPGIRRLFDITGLARRLPLARTFDDVLAALQPCGVPGGNNRATRPRRRQGRLRPSRTIAGGGQPVPGPAPAPSRGDHHDRPA